MRLLIITGKFPGASNDMDGGSIMVSHLIETMSRLGLLDIVFTRSYNVEYAVIPKVNKVMFHTCKERDENKFSRRLKNIVHNATFFASLFQHYDRVAIVHCSKAFGLEDVLGEEELNKIILFPMFLTPSYSMSGEHVPCDYELAERSILKHIPLIVTPSYEEKKELKDHYSVPEQRIRVIPRGISPLICNNGTRSNKSNHLLYIASIKKQKSPLEAIKLIMMLRNRGVPAHLTIAGRIQEPDLYEKCLSLMESQGLSSQITIKGVLSQADLATLINEVDINISLSKWETFGRGIVEGLCGGLPTVVMDTVTCLKDFLDDECGLVYSNGLDSMADEVEKLLTDDSYYGKRVSQTRKAFGLFSFEKECRGLTRLFVPTPNNQRLYENKGNAGFRNTSGSNQNVSIGTGTEKAFKEI